MKIRRIILMAAIAGAAMISGCQRELDCIYCPTPPVTTPTVRDTVKIDSSFHFQSCSQCDSAQPLPVNTWSLKTNRSYVCGVVNYFYFDPGKFSFGFGGEPKCTVDTGFILNATSSVSFTTDRFNLSTTNQAFTLKDQRAIASTQAEYILRTGATAPDAQTLTVVVDTFLNSTKLMIGRFYGFAYTKENKKTNIEGRFRIIIQ